MEATVDSDSPDPKKLDTIVHKLDVLQHSVDVLDQRVATQPLLYPKRTNDGLHRVTSRVIYFVGLLAIGYGINHFIAANVRDHQETVTQNVIGTPEPEQFVEKDGRRYFLQIDGQQVEDYVRKQ